MRPHAPTSLLLASTRASRKGCSAGQYVNETTMTCNDCPVARYASTDQTGECNSCGEGSATGVPGEGATSCTACEGGTYATAQGTACLECPAGTRSSSRASECDDCDKVKAHPPLPPVSPTPSYTTLAAALEPTCPFPPQGFLLTTSRCIFMLVVRQRVWKRVHVRDWRLQLQLMYGRVFVGPLQKRVPRM